MDEKRGFAEVPSPYSAFFQLAQQYNRAAAVLRAEDDGTADAPMLLLFRHAFELYLKCILHDLHNMQPDALASLSHKLVDIKNRLNNLKTSDSANWRIEDLNTLTECANSWQTLDRYNVQFRYPYDRDNKSTIALEISSIAQQAMRNDLIWKTEKAFEVCERYWEQHAFLPCREPSAEPEM